MKPLYIPNEKRSITNENENEFMPVTKRMNYLSIENSNSETASSSRSSLVNEDDSNDSGYRYKQSSSSTKTKVDNTQSNRQNDLMYLNEIYRTYNPSLKVEQNPNYYHANRILFEAHQMRMLRIQTQLLDTNNQKLK